MTPEVSGEAAAFIAVTEKSGGRWDLDHGGASIHGQEPNARRASAELVCGPNRWKGEGEDLDQAVLQVRKRFRQGDSS